MKQMFELRARVFKDQLDWDVEVRDGMERDGYDDYNPVYIIWCDSEKKTLYGALRLLPTTGPTLLYDVFRETFPPEVDLAAPGIWEGTRLCVDHDMLERDFPGLSASRGFCIMLLALCEIAMQNGIGTMISNFEPWTLRLYRMAGARIEILGTSDRYGRKPVSAGAFEVSREVLETMRRKIGIPCSLLLPIHENWLVPPQVVAESCAA